MLAAMRRASSRVLPDRCCSQNVLYVGDHRQRRCATRRRLRVVVLPPVLQRERTVVRTVAEYRYFAEDCRTLAAKLTDPNDKRGMELMAAGWDKVANKREALLKTKSASATLWEPDQF